MSAALSGSNSTSTSASVSVSGSTIPPHKSVFPSSSPTTFYQHASVYFDQPISSLSISPTNEHVVLAARKGLFIVSLDQPHSKPTFIHHPTRWDVTESQWNPHMARKDWIASTSNQKCLIWTLTPNNNTASPSSYQTVRSYSTPQNSSFTSLPSATSSSSTNQYASTLSNTSASKHIAYVLNAHTRAISDLNWSPFHPELIVTCSMDSYVHIWDLRTPNNKFAVGSGVADESSKLTTHASLLSTSLMNNNISNSTNAAASASSNNMSLKPVTSFCAWTKGATTVSFNYLNENWLASAHDTDIRVWDIRKGTSPLLCIHAHDSKIYGLDWSRHKEDELVTCGQDRFIKFWSLNETTENQSHLIKQFETPTPVFRARYTPFGNGLLTIPQRQHSYLSLYDLNAAPDETAPINTSDRVGVRQVHQFQGHKSVVREFVWRNRKDEYQLVTWSKDQHLRLWPLHVDTMKSIHHVPSRALRSQSRPRSGSASVSGSLPSTPRLKPSVVSSPALKPVSGLKSSSILGSGEDKLVLRSLDAIAAEIAAEKHGSSDEYDENFDDEDRDTDDEGLIAKAVISDVARNEDMGDNESDYDDEMEDEGELGPMDEEDGLPDTLIRDGWSERRTNTHRTGKHVSTTGKSGLGISPENFYFGNEEDAHSDVSSESDYETSRRKKHASSPHTHSSSVSSASSLETSSSPSLSMSSAPSSSLQNPLMNQFGVTGKTQPITSNRQGAAGATSAPGGATTSSSSAAAATATSSLPITGDKNVPFPVLCGGRFSPSGHLITFFSVLPHPSNCQYPSFTMMSSTSVKRFTHQPHRHLTQRPHQQQQHQQQFFAFHHPRAYSVMENYKKWVLASCVTAQNDSPQATTTAKTASLSPTQRKSKSPMLPQQHPTQLPTLPQTVFQKVDSSKISKHHRQHSDSSSALDVESMSMSTDTDVDTDAEMDAQKKTMDKRQSLQQQQQQQQQQQREVAFWLGDAEDEEEEDEEEGGNSGDMEDNKNTDDVKTSGAKSMNADREDENVDVVSSDDDMNTESNANNLDPTYLSKLDRRLLRTSPQPLTTPTATSIVYSDDDIELENVAHDFHLWTGSVGAGVNGPRPKSQESSPTSPQDRQQQQQQQQQQSTSELLSKRFKVQIKDISSLLPVCRKLAQSYSLVGTDPIDMCYYNAQMAWNQHHRLDIAKVWSLVAFILYRWNHPYYGNLGKSFTTCRRRHLQFDDMGKLDLMYEHALPTTPAPVANVAASASSLFSSSANMFSMEEWQELDGTVPWGMHPFGRKLVADIMKNLERRGDVQTIALLSCVLSIPFPSQVKNSSNTLKGDDSDGDDNMAVTGVFPNPSQPFSFVVSVSTNETFDENLVRGHHRNCGAELFDRATYNMYRIVYANMLYDWGLLEQRAEVLKFVTTSKDTAKVMMMTTMLDSCPIGPNESCNNSGFWLICPTCSVSQLVPVDGHFYCPRCDSSHLGMKCAICNLMVKGLANFCIKCHHGGCANHMKEWFDVQRNSECPTGCGCMCIFVER